MTLDSNRLSVLTKQPQIGYWKIDGMIVNPAATKGYKPPEEKIRQNFAGYGI
jgi:hypothetical protein